MATETITLSGVSGVSDYVGQYLNSSNANVGSSFSIPVYSGSTFQTVQTIPAGAVKKTITSATTGMSVTRPIVADQGPVVASNIFPGVYYTDGTVLG
jgi:hypothetical protein